MLYKIAKAVVSIIFYPLYRIQVIGKENIPQKGAVLLCSNHISNLDPPVVGITSTRDIYFMAKGELFENPFLGKLLTGIHAFPVKKGAQRSQRITERVRNFGRRKNFRIISRGNKEQNGKNPGTSGWSRFLCPPFRCSSRSMCNYRPIQAV